MIEPGATTFARVLAEQVSSGVIAPTDSVLVQFAGSFDERVCATVGLSNCEFVNIAPGSASTGHTIASKFDAHRMPQPDLSYDHVVAHSGLHHCSRPHEALHEMYRLARKTVIFVENQESRLMGVAKRVGVVGSYELPAVVGGGYITGGVDGTGVPNFVWRWTRRELEKTVAAYDPAFVVPVEVQTEWNIAIGRVSAAALRRKLRLSSDDQAERVLLTGQRLMNKVAPRQGNIFAATIRKDLATLQSWMDTPTSMRRI